MVHVPLMFLSEWLNFLRHLALQGKELDDSSRLDVVEIARVPFQPILLQFFYMPLNIILPSASTACFLLSPLWVMSTNILFIRPLRNSFSSRPSLKFRCGIVLYITYCTVHYILHFTSHIVLYITYCTLHHILYCTSHIVLYITYCTLHHILYFISHIVLYITYCTVHRILYCTLHINSFIGTVGPQFKYNCTVGSESCLSLSFTIEKRFFIVNIYIYIDRERERDPLQNYRLSN